MEESGFFQYKEGMLLLWTLLCQYFWMHLKIPTKERQNNTEEGAKRANNTVNSTSSLILNACKVIQKWSTAQQNEGEQQFNTHDYGFTEHCDNSA